MFRGSSGTGRELLAGLVTSLALIPEVISFSIVAGVDPRVGLLSSFTFSVVIAICGGRPAMVSSAAGSMALVAAPLVRSHGLGALEAATVCAGVLQVILSQVGIPRLIASLPRSVSIGFVNGLAILIFLAQLDHIISVKVLVLTLIGFGLILVFRARLPRIPPTMLSTILLTVTAAVGGLGVPTVSDAGALPGGLPSFHLPDVPVSFGELGMIAPYAVSLALVGLIESLLTADLIDRLTETQTSRKTEARGQGIANVITAFFGGQPGCAMIGQSLLCVASGGRRRLSTMAAGAWLLILVVLLHPLLKIMPMAALVATMFFVALSTFDFTSIEPARLRAWPWSETATMIVTTGVIVWTSNLAIGVGVGTLLAGLLLLGALRAPFTVVIDEPEDGSDPILRVTGPVFFASTGRIIDALSRASAEAKGAVVAIDLTHAELLDTSAVLALDDLIAERDRTGGHLRLTGLTEASRRLCRRVTTAQLAEM